MDHVLGRRIGTLTLINLLSICACLNGHRGFQALSSDAALYPLFRSAPSPQCGRHIMSSRAETAGLAPLRAKSGWIIALGVVYVIAGLIALGSVVFATVVTVFIVGIMMLIAGVAEVFNAFQIKSWGKFLLWMLLGGLYIVAGFLTFENPLLAAAVLTLLLGFSLIASGVMRIVLGFSMHEGMPWIGVVLSGIITLLLGLIIVIHWPVSGLYILGLF